MANTDKLSLPLIEPNMTADVPRDMNALAEAVDAKVGVAGGLAVLGADGKVPADQLNVKDPADASTTQKGIVQLTNATNSTSETLAPTAKALKTTYDLAAGAVRTKDIASGTNLNTLVTNGLYRITDKASYPNAPADYGILQVSADNPGYITQTFINVLNSQMFFRGRTESGTWAAWREVAASFAGENRAPMVFRGQLSGDFNTFLQTGYYIIGADNWTGMSNYPTVSPWGNAYPYGVLEVINTNNAVSQIYRAHSDSQVWSRAGFNNSPNNWQAWQRLLNQADYNTLFQLSVDTKGKVATAVNGKGGTANSGMTGDQLAAAISNLPVKRFASGTFNGQTATAANSSVGASMTVSVNNMTFLPKRVFIRLRLKDTYNNLYIEGYATSTIPVEGDTSMYGRFNNRISISDFTQQSGGFSCLIGSSRIQDYAGASSTAVIEAYQWFAYE